MPKSKAEIARENGKKSKGRPEKAKQPRVRRDVALDVLDVINAGKSDLNPTGRNEVKRWIEFCDSKIEDIALRALGRLKDSADGKPAEKTEEKIVFDPNQPLRVIVEHIGGSQNKASAQTK
jgi:predicted Zn-dependent protease